MIGQLIEEGPRCAGSSEGWNWIVPRLGILTKDCGTNCDVGHDADVDGEAAQRRERLVVDVALELEDGNVELLGAGAQRVRLRAGLLGRHEDARDGVAAVAERVERGTAEGLLAD
jgi:hypothetical protein